VTAETKVIGEEEEGAMGIQTPPSTISIRNAHLGDGKMMWRLAQESGLDLNSPYMYNLFCRHFTDSCAVAIDEHDEVVAYLLGYKPPSTEENALFVWQIGVHPNHQRRGTALKMINWLATKMDVSYLQATVTPSNDESNALFQKFAIVNNCHSCIQDDWIAQDDFPSANKHEAESLYTIGPFELRSTGKELPLSATLCDKNHAILSDITEKESNARSYVRRFPFMVAKAEGRTLTDTSGRSYLDFLGCAGTLALGHSHPVQVEAMRKHLDDKKPLQLLDFATTAKADFMKELFTFLPEAFNDDYRIQFCGAGGSDAVDAAVKLCKIATGRKVVFAFDGAYHGMGQGTLSMMGNLGNKNVPSILSDAHFLPFPSSYRHPFGLSNTNGEGDTAVLRSIERVLDDPESGVTKPACVVLEVVQGEGGLNSFSDWALRELRRITQERDIPLVVDEIQSGFCRTGRRFAFEHSGITPDVVILSKAGGGSQPLSCIVYNKKLDVWGPGMHAGTFRGNGLAFSAGAATLKFMRSERLWQQAEQKGQLFRRLLLGAQCEYIGDVRGMGLMLGIELVNPEERGIDGLPKPSGELTAQTQTECLKRGLVIEKGGRNGSVLRPLPPLTVSEDEINRAASIILESIKAAAASIF
jgi:diaminobutyrate-2-oxoglutarate transaminase